MGKCSRRKEVTSELGLEGRIVVSTQKKKGKCFQKEATAYA